MTSSRPDSILVLGAGELGVAVIKSLAAHPPHNSVLNVLLRPFNKPSRQTLLSELKDLEVTVAYGDVGGDSAEVLADIFRGYTTIISCVGFAAGAGTQMKLARAVLSAGIARYIPWQFGVDYDVIGRGSPQDLFDEQLDVRDLLRDQTHTLWKIISTGMFTSFLFEPSFGVVDLGASVCRALGSWETAVTVTTPQDIAMLTARIAREVWNGSGVIYTAGDTITYGRLADVVERVSTKKVAREVWSVEHLVKQLKDDPTDGTKKYRAVFAMGNGVAWPIERTYNHRNGIEVEGVESWLAQHLQGR
ncbi:saccharopine dehydrogenase-like oxidoreductase [Mycena crocata]|nr:saccharopine dehydrogenase-like oxidoreductase [Mycena crocata]